MNQVQFASYIRYKTKTNSTTFTDAQIILLANIIKDDMAKEITKANEDYFGMEFFRNLVAGKRKYTFPSDILNQMKTLEAKLDGVNFKRLGEFDLNSYRKTSDTTDEAAILANWAGKDPQFDIYGSQVIIYSDSAITDVTDGLKLRAIIYPADISSLAGTNSMSVSPSNTSFGMPTQFHKIWATKVIVEYKTSKDKPIPLTEGEMNVDKDFQLAINAIKGQNLDRSVIATLPDNFNNGQDL
jgi:hypothetical protein